MIARNARLILIADITILLSNIISSLVGARALGPAGRGDLLVIVLWPPVVAMLAGLGLPTAYRYWMAREPERVSYLFSNAVLYTIAVGVLSVAAADLIVPHLVGQRSPQVMMLLRIYQVNIPAALFLDLMRGLLEGTRRFGWAGAARMIFFGVQAFGFAGLWTAGHLTVATAMITMIIAQTSSMLLALIAVLSQLRPSWKPSWVEFKNSMHYAVRDYPGGVADFTTLRLDQLVLAAMASNVAIGLYVVAVRLSEMTTLAADAIADALMPEVAASKVENRAELLWARSLRLAIYMHLVLLPPLWLGAPLFLKILFGDRFVPATGAFRWLLVAAGVWSLGSIVISGLRGFGYPGLSTLAKFSAAAVTTVGLLVLLPRWGITGAAIASLIGYTVMLVIALFAFVKKRRLDLWSCLRPRWRDLLVPNWRSLLGFTFAKPDAGEAS
ncbi:MAG TPA: polysaccharide biosynthesis C-terminal domain-containing protein [Pyrinomonadaceae bacterium]|nr:polysaccharide biosynthesis C-terminal domain-containing protein [Pyrinomonadaceae bacterium]